MITLTAPATLPVRYDRFTPDGAPRFVYPAPYDGRTAEVWTPIADGVDPAGPEESEWSVTRSGSHRIRSSVALGNVTVQLFEGARCNRTRRTMVPVLELRGLSVVAAAELVARLGLTVQAGCTL